MIFYRTKQFYWAMESLIKEDDFDVLNRHLNKYELGLFMKMNKSERQHSIRVCKATIKYIQYNNILDIDKDKMCRCALLHDIGKSQVKLNVFQKSITVIMNGITFGKFLKYNKNKRISSYYNHPEIGANLLDGIKGMDLDIINCVRYHHNKNYGKKNIYLKILIMCDNCN